MNKNRKAPIVDSRIKKQTVLALSIGLVLGSILVFTAVWSGTLKHLEQARTKGESLPKDVPSLSTGGTDRP